MQPALVVALRQLDARTAARLAVCRALASALRQQQPRCLLTHCFRQLMPWLACVDRHFAARAQRERYAYKRLAPDGQNLYRLPRRLCQHKLYLSIKLPALPACSEWCAEPLVALVPRLVAYVLSEPVFELDTCWHTMHFLLLARGIEARLCEARPRADGPQQLYLPIVDERLPYFAQHRVSLRLDCRPITAALRGPAPADQVEYALYVETDRVKRVPGK